MSICYRTVSLDTVLESDLIPHIRLAWASQSSRRRGWRRVRIAARIARRGVGQRGRRVWVWIWVVGERRAERAAGGGVGGRWSRLRGVVRVGVVRVGVVRGRMQWRPGRGGRLCRRRRCVRWWMRRRWVPCVLSGSRHGRRTTARRRMRLAVALLLPRIRSRPPPRCPAGASGRRRVQARDVDRRLG